MGSRESNTIFALAGILLCLSIGANASRHADCKCPGPLYYYKELGCKPIYADSHDCCPQSYDCNIWKNLPYDKCLIDGEIYEPGQQLKPEHSNGADHCSCMGRSGWSCTVASCGGVRKMAGQGGPDGVIEECYLQNTPFQMCPGPNVCVKKGTRPTCLVDGKIYRDGEFFIPAAEPEKHCYCGPEYKNQTVEPFCALPKHTWCNNVLYQTPLIRQGCAPVYYENRSLLTDCNVGFRCQHKQDAVIEHSLASRKQHQVASPSCQFGNLTMQIGDELTHNTEDWSAVCVKCVCEVPPVPTCKRLPKSECNPKDYGVPWEM